MIKAIVYTSYAGHTATYAEMLGARTGLPVYKLKEARKYISLGDSILYMGWIMSDSVKGYIKASNLYNVEILIAVGMSDDAEAQRDEIIDKYDISDCDVVYLKGGFDMNKIHGFKRFMMKIMLKGLENDKKNKPLSPENDKLYRMLADGEYCVNESNLDVVEKLVCAENYIKPKVVAEKPPK